MADAVLQHLAGAKLLLGILSIGEKRDQVELLQRDRVWTLLGNAKLSTMDAANIALAVHGSGFSEKHISFLTEVVTVRSADDVCDDKRLQNF